MGIFVYYIYGQRTTMKNPEDNLISVMTNKEITKLYKTLLEIIEDLQKDHDIMLKKVATKNNKEFAENINYFTSEKYEQLRKRILDSGNECDRNLLNFLSFFDSTINAQRVNEAASNNQQRVIYKKSIYSPPVIL
jgi:hypothetical protein